jgi:hypothetical protein
MTLLKPALRPVRLIVSGPAWSGFREYSRKFSFRSRAGVIFPVCQVDLAELIGSETQMGAEARK